MADSRDFPKDWADEMNDEQVSKSRATVSICNRCHHALSQHEFNACYVKGCLCEGLIAAAPAPQAEGTRGVVKNRTVQGGKEFWDHVENVATNFQPPKVGAAPAETARPENDSDIVGVCDDVTRGRTLHVKDIGCINWRPVLVDTGRETAGEMTAEQFIKDYGWNVGFGDLAITDRIRWEMSKFAEAFAKQRVEQAERERLAERAEWEKFLYAAHAARDAFESDVDALEAKVADLDRERDEAQTKYDTLEARYFRDKLTDAAEIGELKDALAAAESELPEMRERVTDLVGIIGRLKQRLARKAGS